MDYRTLDAKTSVMPWDDIDNVVFDVGGVLLTFEPHKIISESLPYSGDKYNDIYEAVFHSPYWPLQDMGITNIKNTAAIMAQSSPELENEINELLDNWVSHMHEILEGIRAVEKCKEKGKRVFILSNFGDSFERAERKHKFFEIFDGKVISYRVKMVKPNPCIYNYLTNKYSLIPSRTVFIDDTPSNVSAAIACGWEGLYYNKTGKLDGFFQSLDFIH